MRRKCPPIFAEQLEPRLLLADASLIKDIYPGATSSYALTGREVSYKGKLFFVGEDKTGGFEPWVSDGTEEGTFQLADINPGSANSNPTNFVVANGFVYFDDGPDSQVQLWRTDGTTTGTVKILNMPNDEQPNLGNANGHLMVFLSTGVSRLDGSTLVKVSNLTGFKFAEAPGQLFFTSGTDLLVTDGFSASLVKQFTSLPSDVPPVSVNGQLFFNAADDGGGVEPWFSSGSPIGTVRLADVKPGSASSLPHDYTVSGGLVYFVADGGANPGNGNFANNQIYLLGGDTVGTLTNLPGTAGSNFAITDLTDVNGTIFFTYQPNGGKRLLYKLDNSGSPVRVGTATGGPDGGTNPTQLINVGGSLFFSGIDNNNTARLFISDGTNISLVSGDAGTAPSGLDSIGSALLFSAFDPGSGTELHATVAPPPPATFTVKLKANNTDIDEGQSTIFTATVKGGSKNAKYKYRWDFDGNGGLAVDGHKPTHLYEDNLPNNAIRRVRVKVIARDGSFKNAYVNVKVRNVAPELQVVVPEIVVRYLPIPYVIRATDPGIRDKVKVDIDFGDGTTEKGISVPKGGFIHGFHVFGGQIGGDFQVTARDKDDYTANPSDNAYILKTIIDTSTDPAYQILGYFGILIGGTPNTDTVDIYHDPVDESGGEKAERIRFINYQNMQAEFELQYKSGHAPGITADLGPGNDSITVHTGVDSNVKAYLGDGADTAKDLGTGKNSFFGEGDHDTLKGKPSDILKQ